MSPSIQKKKTLKSLEIQLFTLSILLEYLGSTSEKRKEEKEDGGGENRKAERMVTKLNNDKIVKMSLYVVI